MPKTRPVFRQYYENYKSDDADEPTGRTVQRTREVDDQEKRFLVEKRCRRLGGK